MWEGGRGSALRRCFQNWAPLYVKEAIESVSWVDQGTSSRLKNVTILDVVHDRGIPDTNKWHGATW